MYFKYVFSFIYWLFDLVYCIWGFLLSLDILGEERDNCWVVGVMCMIKFVRCAMLDGFRCMGIILGYGGLLRGGGEWWKLSF